MKIFKEPEEQLMLLAQEERLFKNVDFTLLTEWPRARYDACPNEQRETLYRETFIRCAQIKKTKAFIQGFKAKMPLDVVSEKGLTLLQSAALFGAKEIVTFLLENGANPAYRTRKQKYDALCAAAVGGQYETALVFLSLLDNANKDEAEGKNLTPLQKHWQKKISRVTTDSDKQSILQIAILNRQYEFAKKWIAEQHPDLNHVDRKGRNALGTTLAIFFRSSFNKFIDNEDKQIRDANLAKLNDFCLFMLNKMNAFEKTATNGIPPIMAVINNHTAINPDPAKAGQRALEAKQSAGAESSEDSDSDSENNQTKKEARTITDPTESVKNLYLNAFDVAKKLYEQASANPGAEGAAKYMNLFGTVDKEIKEHLRNKKRDAEAAEAATQQQTK